MEQPYVPACGVPPVRVATQLATWPAFGLFTWTVELVSARDVAGNTRDADYATLLAAGLPVTFVAND